MHIHLEKPFYTIEISSQLCGYYACINGCPVDVEDQGVPQNISYPINQWLKNGDNEINIYFLNTTVPGNDIMDFYPEAKFQCRILVRENAGGPTYELVKLRLDSSMLPRDSTGLILYDTIEDIENVCEGTSRAGQYSLTSDGLVEDDSGRYTVGTLKPLVESFAEAPLLTLPISIPCPFPLWEFFSADKLVYHEYLSDSEWRQATDTLIAEYSLVANILKRKDFESLDNIFELRCAEYDIAFYKEPGTDLSETKNMFIRDLADPEWPVKDITSRNVEIIVSNNEKMCWLTGFGKHLSSGLALKHTSSNLIKTYPLWFSKINGDWKIVR